MPAHFTILLLQPQNIDSDVLKIMLSSEQLIVNHITNSTDAWNRLHGRNFCDLIVLNLDIPDGSQFHISGLKLLDGIQTDPYWKNIPLIIITNSLSKDQFTQDNLSKKSDCILINPFQPMYFMNKVNNLLNLNLQRHISEMNRQHLEIAKDLHYFQGLIEQQAERITLQEVFTKIKLFICIHFEFEELFMESHYFPETAQHFHAHQVLRQKLSDMLASIQLISTDKVQSLKTDILGDINHDAKYIKFLEDIHL